MTGICELLHSVQPLLEHAHMWIDEFQLMLITWTVVHTGCSVGVKLAIVMVSHVGNTMSLSLSLAKTSSTSVIRSSSFNSIPETSKQLPFYLQQSEWLLDVWNLEKHDCGKQNRSMTNQQEKKGHF